VDAAVPHTLLSPGGAWTEGAAVGIWTHE